MEEKREKEKLYQKIFYLKILIKEEKIFIIYN